MSKTKALREKRAKVHEQMVALGNQVSDNNWSDEQRQKFDAMDADFEKLTSQIATEEKLEARTSKLALEAHQAREEAGETRGDNQTPPGEAKKPEYRDVFLEYTQYGEGELSPENRSILRQNYSSGKAEKRAQTTQTNSSGGYLIPTDLLTTIIETMAQYGGMLQVANILNTTSGNPLNIPTLDDTSNTGALLAENTQASEQDLAFGQKVLNAYKYTSKLIHVPSELLEDSAFNFEAIIGRKFAERLGRILNTHMTTGTGSAQPNGVVTATSEGEESASNSAVTVAELLNLMHSIDPAYQSNARWMFNDGTLSKLKQLSIGASDSRPLWVPSVREGQPDTLWGKPYTINQDLDSIAASKKPILYGDFSNYWIRMVGNQRMRRSEHLKFDYDQVSYVMFQRADGELMDANSIKHLATPA